MSIYRKLIILIMCLIVAICDWYIVETGGFRIAIASGIIAVSLFIITVTLDMNAD